MDPGYLLRNDAEPVRATQRKSYIAALDISEAIRIICISYAYQGIYNKSVVCNLDYSCRKTLE